MGKRILIATYGSRGDVEPFLALALGLKARGHDVALMTSTRFSGWIGDNGVSFLPMSDEALAQIETPDGRAMLDGSTGVIARMMAARRMTAKARPLMAKMLAQTWENAQSVRPDLIIFHPKMLAAPHIAEKLGIPAVLVFLQPMFVPTSEFPAAGLPSLKLPGWNRLSYRLVSLSFALYRKPVNALRARLGLEPVTSAGVLSPPELSPMPVVHPVGRHVLERPGDWPDHALITGFWRLPQEAGYTPDPALAAFLEAGPAPVYAGFGSMPAADPAALGALVVEAIRKAGRRGVIASGWGGLKAADAEDMHVIEAAPHDWLFPRMAAVVHHGGAGTTAAGFRAGVPSVICPFGVDQPWFAELSVKLGVGAMPVPRRKMTVDQLAKSIRQAVEDRSIAGNARALGEKLRQEDGIAEAVGIVEGLLDAAG